MTFLLFVACATPPRSGVGPSGAEGVTRYEQSLDSATSGCMRNPACYSQPGSEAILPAVGRSVAAARGVGTALRILDAAELARIEQLLIQCSKAADQEVNEREYGPGKKPDDAECERVVRHVDGKPLRRRMELGTMKHAVAFACVRRELSRLFPDNVSVEPRYGFDARTGRPVLTERWVGSLRPDVVIHFAKEPSRVQCVYDFKFPCTKASKSNPLASPELLQQLERYEALGGHCPPAIITPQLGVSRD
ncbi:hypothetical protein [Myxococcus fulvus]|uniref:hypothetical protein n=1 Tax=Myxococcus fulvus TaxID=33 RepID=UPI0020C07BDC|nr:hypothetical protein [Myxococcus fulvus]